MTSIELSFKRKKQNFKKGISAKEVLDETNLKNKKNVLAAKINGKVIDLQWRINESGILQFLTFKDPEGKDVFRHSTAHVFAHAVKRLYPNALNTIGPPVEEGFYYDFDNLQITERDFENIEKEMKKIVKKNYPFKYRETSINEIKKLFKNNPYKIELAEDFKKQGQKLTLYEDGDFTDLCEGPHVPSTGYVKAFKLTKIAGAYWRGNQKNKQLTRIYGISFPDEKHLRKHLQLLEELKKRDHRLLGRELDLFTINDVVGGGLPVFHPKGTVIRQEIINFVSEQNSKLGFKNVFTPHVAKSDLWHMSGHYEAYKDRMFIFESDEHEHAVKPMNCPLHSQIFASHARSYRDLPVRLAEFATVYRNEQSGELTGLLRVRSITQDDGHAYVTEDQIEEEVAGIVKSVIKTLTTFGLKKIQINLSTRPEKFIGDEKIWDKATNALENALKKVKVKYVMKDGEGAFYGPKIDFDVKDSLGRSWQCSTIQLDFFMPRNLGLEYTGKDNKKHIPVIIHRALVGSVERFMAILIEHYAGKLPLWLSPVHARILTVGDRFNKYAEKVAKKMENNNIRVEVDDSAETIGKKVRAAQLQKIPYILVVGDREMKNKTVTVRTRDNVIHGEKKVKDFIEGVSGKILTRDASLA